MTIHVRNDPCKLSSRLKQCLKLSGYCGGGTQRELRGLQAPQIHPFPLFRVKWGSGKCVKMAERRLAQFT